MEKNQTMQQKAPRSFCLRSFRMTRAFWVLLFCGLCMTAMPVNAQDSKVTLHVKDMPLGDVVKELRKQTGKDFLFSNREVDANQKVTVDVTAKPLKDVLSLVFGKDFRFEISENVVIVRPFVAPAEGGQKGGFVVKGIVTDKQKQPLPGVTVKVANTSVGTATNQNGYFNLRLPITKGALEFSFIGFKSQSVDFTENTKDTIRVTLVEDVTGLNEVQVVAYGTQKKRTSVSAISSIKAEDMKELPTHSLENLLQGHMAGVEVNNMSGSPGGGGSIVAIRGYNSFFSSDELGRTSEGEDRSYGTPLYVVDGVPIQAFTSPVTGTNTLSNLDPSMIESIEVLKDAASAAIYGSRAGNGVILITTKKGRTGKAMFTANVSYSAAWLPKSPTQSGGRLERNYNIQGLINTVTPYKGRDGIWRIPSSYEEVYNYTGSESPEYDWFWGNAKGANNAYDLQDSLNPFYNNSTNWWKYAFRTAKVYNANIQASGGSENIQFMIGAGYYKEEGIMLGSDFQRVNVLTNISATLSKKLKIDNQLSLSYSDRSRGGSGASGSQKVEGMTVDPNIQSTLLPGDSYIKENMLETLNSVVEKNHNYSARYNLVLDYEIIRNLRLRVSGGIDYQQDNLNNFAPSTNDPIRHWSVSRGTIGRNISILNENLLSYNFALKQDHNFDVLLGLSFQKDQAYNNSGSATNGPNDYVQYVQGQWGDINGLLDKSDAGSSKPSYSSAFSYSSNLEEQRLNSYFGRFRYNYKEKYMLETTIRRDGSSVFGEKVRWATFPSVAVGWAFSEEAFLKKFYWLSFGKVRASWGKSGQKFSQPYLAQGLMDSNDETFLGSAGMIPSSKGGMINRKLSWQETAQYDLGLDMSMFDYRLKFTLDYYYRYTKGELNQISLPGDVFYHSFQWQNALDVSNQGIELELTADLFRETEVKWRMKFNVSRNWNRFEKSSDGFDFNGNVKGKPLYRMGVYKTDGYYASTDDVPVYPTTSGMPQPLYGVNGGGIFFAGTRRIVDLDGDGRIGESDMYYAASPLPTAYGGFINEIKWKQFDVNIFFNYSLGRHILNMTRYATLKPGSAGSPIFADIRNLDTWQGPDSKNADYPYFQMYSQLPVQYSGRIDSNMETVHMLRLKQLTLGYNLHEQVARRIGLSAARLFCTFENLFMLTNYSGLDPEIVNVTTGIDNQQGYPLPRKFTVGLTINF